MITFMKPTEFLKEYIPLSKKFLRNVPGIYFIYNVVTEKIYIGYSKHPRGRWTGHKSDLENQRHFSVKMQEEYNTYGKWAFHYGVIENCKLEDLEHREIFYYKLLDKDFLYNFDIPGKGKKLSEEHKKKLSMAAKKRHEEYEKKYGSKFFGVNPPICYAQKKTRERTEEVNSQEGLRLDLAKKNAHARKKLAEQEMIFSLNLQKEENI